MKKLLYIAPVIVDVNRLNGVSKKILSQVRVFETHYDVEFISYGVSSLNHYKDNQHASLFVNSFNRRIALYKWLLGNTDKYDYIYIRYHLSDPLFLFVLKSLKKCSNKIVIETPTYPYRQENLRVRKAYLELFVDDISSIFLKFFVNRIITYSDHEEIFGIKTIKTSNGIIFNEVKKVRGKFHPFDEINLISVSVTNPYHGYDRIIEGLYKYYQNGGDVKIIYHLVGEGSEIHKYKELITRYNLEMNVILYGFRSGQELDEVYDKADIAINSVAIHRSGLKTQSTLKAIEYAAKGLPIISSYKIDAFDDYDNLRYVCLVQPEDDPIEMDRVIRFYQGIYMTENEDVSSEIRQASINRSDMNITMKPIVDYFNSKDDLEE